jgi:CheY-like chemotaxis protein
MGVLFDSPGGRAGTTEISTTHASEAAAVGGVILETWMGVTTIACTIPDVSLPDQRGPSAAFREISRIAVKNHPLHVLVVDDEPLIRWSVTETLAGLGSDVEQANSAAAALQAITTNALAFDVIVMDLRLPDMNDLSLLATIRQLLPDAAVVLMTAFSTPEIMTEARRLGVRGVLQKPFELTELASLVMGGRLGHTGAFS